MGNYLVIAFHFCLFNQIFTECLRVASTGLGLSKTDITPVPMEHCLAWKKLQHKGELIYNMTSAIKQRHMKYWGDLT